LEKENNVMNDCRSEVFAKFADVIEDEGDIGSVVNSCRFDEGIFGRNDCWSEIFAKFADVIEDEGDIECVVNRLLSV
jgi:hypothetical protein